MGVVKYLYSHHRRRGENKEGNMIIQQIRNATLKIQYSGAMFLVDPWLQDKGTGFSVTAVRPEMQGVRCPMNDLPDTT